MGALSHGLDIEKGMQHGGNYKFSLLASALRLKTQWQINHLKMAKTKG